MYRWDNVMGEKMLKNAIIHREVYVYVREGYYGY